MIDRLTWQQLGLMAECIAMHEVERLEMVLTPAMAAMGVDYTPSSVSRQRDVWREAPENKAQNSRYSDNSEEAKLERAMARDARLFAAAAANGIGVYEAPASPSVP